MVRDASLLTTNGIFDFVRSPPEFILSIFEGRRRLYRLLPPSPRLWRAQQGERIKIRFTLIQTIKHLVLFPDLTMERKKLMKIQNNI